MGPSAGPTVPLVGEGKDLPAREGPSEEEGADSPMSPPFLFKKSNFNHHVVLPVMFSNDHSLYWEVDCSSALTCCVQIMLLPSSTIQTIIEHYQEIHDINQSHLLSKLNQKLTSLGLSEADRNTVIETLKNEDLHRTTNIHTLKTDHKRKTFFKSNFNYVEPVSIYFGQNESGKECFGQYVPVKKTIESLLSSETVREQLQQAKNSIQPDNVLQDVWDGTNIEKNLLLNQTASSLGVILYQDSFEVVNPLGSGRKKHKILAVYLTLANIEPYNRSSVDQMQLVLLCREQDYKYFGQDLVFGSLVKDLKDLELNGVILPDGQLFKGTL